MIELLVAGIVIWIGLCVLVLSLSAMAASGERQGVVDAAPTVSPEPMQPRMASDRWA